MGIHLSYYIGNYKGGRNESFMYGSDEKPFGLITIWWVLNTTGMSHLALPQYSRGMLIKPETIKVWTTEEFLKGYLIVNGLFTFPKDTKYPLKPPSIPCYIDSTSTVYPTGSCLLIGPEYLLAKNQGCDIEIK